MIHLVGPGGAGKSTIGSELASGLAILPFIDLDLEFTEHVGDISHHIDHRGYHYLRLRENVRLCRSHHSHTWTRGYSSLFRVHGLSRRASIRPILRFVRII